MNDPLYHSSTRKYKTRKWISPYDEVEGIVRGLFLFYMIDIDLFRKILSADDGYIENGDTIPFELFEMMYCFPIDKVLSLFAKKKDKCPQEYNYDVQIRCPECGRIITRQFNKTGLLNAISFYRGKVKQYRKIDYLCDECQVLERKRMEVKREQEISSMQNVIAENTEHFIDNYLNKNKEWNKDVPLNRRFYNMFYANVDWTKIKDFICKLDYQDFLQTPYWKAISDKVKRKAKYRCIICNSNSSLSTHHRCYTHHGDEIHHLEDLICICQECHNKHHFE